MLHGREIVREHLERDRQVGHGLQHIEGESLVIGDAGLPHQRRIGGEALDQRVLRRFANAFDVGAIGENLDLQLIDGFVIAQVLAACLARICVTASGSDRATMSGVLGPSCS